MRVLLQRVLEAAVMIEGREVAAIQRGYLLFLCVMRGDTEKEARWLAEKVCKLRLFTSDYGTVNTHSVLEVGGEILVVPEFTLAARVEKGNRPDYTAAAPPSTAENLYNNFIQSLRGAGVQHVAQGIFGAMMEVRLTNDGPVTLLLEKGGAA